MAMNLNPMKNLKLLVWLQKVIEQSLKPALVKPGVQISYV